MNTYAYGFPRLGKNREFKKTIEDFWKSKLSAEETQKALAHLQDEMLNVYERSVDQFPAGEMTGYDQMLDTAIMVGLYRPQNLKEYYDLCRGKNALEMTKWFNTNYHYLVPDFAALGTIKFKAQMPSAQQKGNKFLLGPFTFLKLSKGVPANKFAAYAQQLAEVYREILAQFQEVHIEEPAFVLDLTADEIKVIQYIYTRLGAAKCRINLITYYESVSFFKELLALPVAAIGLDFVHGNDNLKSLKKYGFPKDKTLIAGLVNGRNVWRTDIGEAVTLLKEITAHADKVVVSNAAPLYHLPISLAGEEKLPAALKERLAFAEGKLQDIQTIAKVFVGEQKYKPVKLSALGIDNKVRNRVKGLKPADFKKTATLSRRRELQKKLLGLPLFPTTTIGSFPQTEEVRKARADFRAGRLTAEQYKKYVRQKIDELIRQQEEWGLDVLVHGEFERTDMVEFFAEKLDGIATTQNGWVISYGTRAYRPPIIFGDIRRPRPMTVEEIAYAQSRTRKPVKGMLTGPITIIAWSFVREDVPLKDVAYQLGLALQDEVRDYERSGIKIVQIDEPAIREKAPIKHKDWPAYFDWAIKSFNLSANTAPETQIHTHMCYSEFGEIMKEIDKMDFDVISIESTRSRGDIIASFEKINFKKQIGLGVWDIHSPVVPSVSDMRAIVKRALKVFPQENFWINPDCGLKTRGWDETKTSLENLITLSQELRKV